MHLKPKKKKTTVIIPNYDVQSSGAARKPIKHPLSLQEPKGQANHTGLLALEVQDSRARAYPMLVLWQYLEKAATASFLCGKADVSASCSVEKTVHLRNLSTAAVILRSSVRIQSSAGAAAELSAELSACFSVPEPINL